tara:strand:- start:595 stop:774 length:180 start_codon:yes stop_codon:yes gene_type:complete
MKLRTPFSVNKNALSDTRVIHYFNYEVPAETREEFGKEECEDHQLLEHAKFMTTDQTTI